MKEEAGVSDALMRRRAASARYRDRLRTIGRKFRNFYVTPEERQAVESLIQELRGEDLDS